MKIKWCMALVLVPCLAQAVGPSPSACSQAYGSMKQRLAQAVAEQDDVAAHDARRKITAIVSQCQAAQRQRQYLENTQALDRNVELKRLQQQRTDQRLNQQRLDQQRIEQQRLRQKMYQQRLDNQRRIND
jgi:hypothetical protein